MENTKYICPECGYESEVAGSCPHCNVMLVASCAVCGNPVVGEHIRSDG